MLSSSDTLNAAIRYHQAGQLSEAEQLYREILQQEPCQEKVMYLLGLASHQNGDLAIASEWYQQALAVNPNYIDAHNNLGVLLQQQGNLQRAADHYQAALRLNPINPKVHANLGVILQQLGQVESAIAHYETAMQLDPNLAAAYTNLAHALKELGQLDAAIAHYRSALKLMPTNPDAYRDLGDALQEMGNVEEALVVYDRAISFAPHHIELKGSRIRALLISGKLKEGFAGYDQWRLELSSQVSRFKQPVWDGSRLEGQTILLYAEPGSGMGDSIQFIRYVPLVIQHGGKVIVECQPSLVPLFEQMSGLQQVLPWGSPLPEFSVQASLLSLPRILGTTLENIPNQCPYLAAPEPLMFDLPKADLATLKVGLVWGGNPQHSNDRDRACPLSELRPLLNIPGITFYSLQKGIHQEALKSANLPIIDLGDRLHNFADTAAAIAQLDLVISVDTAVAHLAGAMGKPVWILLSFAPDWRWLMDRTDSPWYPTARLFRQSRRQDWAGVCASVATALQDWSRDRAH